MDSNKITIAEYLQRIDERQGKIESLMLSQKTVLTFDEVATYTGLSKSYLYKLSSTGGIPCYKPRGKSLYCSRQELDNWLLSNKIKSSQEIEQEASTYTTLTSK